MRIDVVGKVFGRRASLEALRCLYWNKAGLSGREIARRTGLSHLGIHNALGELERERIVSRRMVPPAHVFSINEKHWVFSEVLSGLFEKESRWQEDLEKFIRGTLPGSAVSLALYGSVLEPGLQPESDIDVLALGMDGAAVERIRKHLGAVSVPIYEVFGHPLSPVIMTMCEFGERHRSGEGFAKRVAYSGKVIHGWLLTEVLARYGRKKDGR